MVYSKRTALQHLFGRLFSSSNLGTAKAQELYIPPTTRPEIQESSYLSDVLRFLNRPEQDIHGLPWALRKMVEESRYANVVDDFSRNRMANLRKCYEERLQDLDKDSEDEEKQGEALKASRASTRMALKERLAANLEEIPLFQLPDALSLADGSNLGTSGGVPTAMDDNFFSPSNEEFVASGAYGKLRPKHHEFRLLRVLPGKWDEEIHCELVGPVVIEQERFDVLSYSAGNLNDVRLIKVNGFGFHVFSSLFRALWQLRRDYLLEERNQNLVWVDQICINQHDAQEKAQQVLFMRNIYHRASRTIIWLGEQDTNSLGMMYATEITRRENDFLKDEIMKSIRNPNSAPADGIEAQVALGHLAMKKTAAWLVDQALDDEMSLLPLIALSEIFDASWWQRCWVVQELVVSKNPVMVWGKASDTWTTFKTVAHVLQYASKLLFHEIRLKHPGVKPVHEKLAATLYAQTANDMRILGTTWKYSGNIRLRDVLCIARQLGCTDPRDRVFSFLGLLTHNYKIVPNYEKSRTPQKVFHEACVRSVTVDGSLDILCDRELRNVEHENTIPSWVPDYSVSLRRRGICDWHFQQSFHASKDMAPNFSFETNVDSRLPDVLHLSVISIGSKLSSDDLRDWDKGEHLSKILFNKEGSIEARDENTTQSPDLDLLQTILIGLDEKAMLKFFMDYFQRLSKALGKPYAESDADERPLPSGSGIETSSVGHEVEAETDSKDPSREQMLEQIDHKLILEDAYRRFQETTENTNAWRLVSTNQFYALVPPDTKEGDRIYVVPGVSVPLIFRPLPTHRDASKGGDRHRAMWLIGPAYVQGYMDGKAIDQYNEGVTKMTRIKVL